MRHWESDIEAIKKVAGFQQDVRTVHGALTQVTPRGVMARLDGSQRFVSVMINDQESHDYKSGDRVLLARHKRAGIRAGWFIVSVLKLTRSR